MRYPSVPAAVASTTSALALSITAIASLTLPGTALAVTANSLRFQLDFERNCFTTAPTDPADIDLYLFGLRIAIEDLVLTLNPNVIPPNSALCEQYRDAEGPADQIASDITPDETPAQNTSMLQQSTDQIHNVSAYLRNQRLQALEAAAITQNQQLKDYIGGSAGNAIQIGRLGFFINGSYVDGNQDNTIYEVGYDLSTDHVTVGADYRFHDSFIAGFAYGNSNTKLEYTEARNQTDSTTDHYILYSSWYSGHFAVDTLLGFAQGELDTQRHILGSNAIGNTDSEITYFNLAASYDFVSGAFTYGPLLSVDYVDGTIDRYAEANGGGWEAAFEEQDIRSQIVTLGGDISYAASFNCGVLVPHAGAEWRTEMDDERDLITGHFVLDPAASFSIIPDEPDRHWYQVSTGLSAQFTHGIAAFLNYEEILDYDDTDLSTVTLGVRMEM